MVGSISIPVSDAKVCEDIPVLDAKVCKNIPVSDAKVNIPVLDACICIINNPVSVAKVFSEILKLEVVDAVHVLWTRV